MLRLQGLCDNLNEKFENGGIETLIDFYNFFEWCIDFHKQHDIIARSNMIAIKEYVKTLPEEEQLLFELETN